MGWIVVIKMKPRGKKSMRYAIYYRCSTDKQDIEHQKLAVRRWMKEQGISFETENIVEFFDEGISGAADASMRKGYSALLRAIEKRSIDEVILFEGSRLSRRMLEYLRFMDVASRNGVTVQIVGRGKQAFSNSTDMLLAAVQGFIAEAERENISNRIKSGLAAAKTRGVKLGARRGEPRNFGWRKQLDRDAVDDVIKLHEQGLSNREIARRIGDRLTGKPANHVFIGTLIAREQPKRNLRRGA